MSLPRETIAGSATLLCACGHPASRHEQPATGDTRCLAVEDRRDLYEAFDDGRRGETAYCCCLHWRPQ